MKFSKFLNYFMYFIPLVPIRVHYHWDEGKPIFEALLKHGADLTLLNSRNDTPLTLAEKKYELSGRSYFYGEINDLLKANNHNFSANEIE